MKFLALMIFWSPLEALEHSNSNSCLFLSEHATMSEHCWPLPKSAKAEQPIQQYSAPHYPLSMASERQTVASFCLQLAKQIRPEGEDKFNLILIYIYTCLV